MIDILLATYNGERYIRQQLYSLLAQTYTDWRLFVHDDGSQDKTVELIKEFQKIDNRIVLVEDGVKCGGAGANFLHLLKYTTADYVIFCDQDDIWLENKLEVMYERLKEEKEPCGIFAGGYLYTLDKGITGSIPSPILRDFKDLFFIAGGLQGCSMMFNRPLCNLIQGYDGYMVMHDYLVTLGVLSFGKLIYLQDKLMLYRQQHEGKVTANVDMGIANKAKSKFPVIDTKHHKSFVSFVEKYNDKLTSQQKYIFGEYMKIYHSESLLKRILLVLKNRFRLGNSTMYLVAKMILRPIKER
ncbi:glycosyltransferase family 2 protein [Riemerella anatipestifer]|nr:glycosyltransferase family 2 protein [Riemerella anatipestifer]